MDIRDLTGLTFDDGTFDVAIDRGNHLAFQTVAPLDSYMHIRIGTMDATMTAKGDVWVRFTILQHHVRDPPHLPAGPSYNRPQTTAQDKWTRFSVSAITISFAR